MSKTAKAKVGKKGPRAVHPDEKPPRKDTAPPVLDIRIRAVTLVFDIERTTDGKAACGLMGENGRPLSETIFEADFDEPFAGGLTFPEFVEGFRR